MMVDKVFWEEVQKAWVINAQPKIIDVKTGSGGEIDPSLLQEPWEYEESKPNIEQEAQQFDGDKFDALLEEQTIPGFIAACDMLIGCDLPDSLEILYKKLIERLELLQEVSERNAERFQIDLFEFNEFYLPDVLQNTSNYIEYLKIPGIGEDIIKEAEEDVIEAVEGLLIGINDSIELIKRFAKMDIKAGAKAAANMMSQYGYVDPGLKIK